jgi:mono/diheme cytochrome c family protein
MRRPIKILLALLVLAMAGAAILIVQTARYGLSAHDEPTRVEHVLARAMRRYATPADLRDRKNPVPVTPEVLAEARAHFADHCATCHGNDGKGQTSMGPKFYPKVPDMTLTETQKLSDGEICATIENGVRLTGMPGWGDGTAESARGSWTLVHFVRHLPRITPGELEEMKSLNPKSPAEWEAEKEEREFLEGDGGATSGAPPHSH